MNRITLCILFFLITATLSFAGGDAEQQAHQQLSDTNTITVTDAGGVKVTITQPVEKIVSINSGLSEIVAALGCADRTVGRCSYSTFPSNMREAKHWRR
jgi:iron complex transport system substrate-binding protein